MKGVKSRLLVLGLVTILPCLFLGGPAKGISDNNQGKPLKDKTPEPGGAGNLSLDKWTYIQVDNNRSGQAFGLCFPSLQADGYRDIASGPYFYRNPRGDMTGTWARVELPENVDAMLAVDVDGDGRDDLIAEALPNVYWLKPTDAKGGSWQATLIASGLAPTSHTNSQGYALAQIRPGGKPQIVFSTGKGIYYLQIPANAGAGNWPRVKITGDDTSEEGIGVGDINHDGRVDIVAAYGPNGNEVAWWENPGAAAGNWMKHEVGAVEGWADRIAVADIDGHKRLDIIVTIENGKASGADTYWFEQPADPKRSRWTRHTVCTQGTTNSMDVADMNEDGLVDIITGEHRGSKKVIIWENVKQGTSWVPHLVDSGRESHLGARAVDLDGDGDLDIVSIAWDRYQDLHVWRNDAQRKSNNK